MNNGNNVTVRAIQHYQCKSHSYHTVLHWLCNVTSAW